MDISNDLTPGQLSERSGVAVSALHFYEREGLIASRRTAGNQRRYSRDTLRRVAFIRTSQRVGVPLAEIRSALATLPSGRTPTKKDWSRLSRRWHEDLERRIAQLERLRDTLDDCIGCGCLSLRSCRLHNEDDHLAEDGSGARILNAMTRVTPSESVPADPTAQRLDPRAPSLALDASPLRPLGRLGGHPLQRRRRQGGPQPVGEALTSRHPVAVLRSVLGGGDHDAIRSEVVDRPVAHRLGERR